MEEKRTESPTDRKESITRRGYLKSAGVVVGSTAMVHGASDRVQAGEYRTITVSPGEHRTIRIGSGETLENVLIDATASGASVSIRASGSDWTVRNVGIKGTMPDIGRSDAVALTASGDGTVEHCYFGDGSVPSSRWTGMASWGSHSGHIAVRECYFAEWDDNAIYSTDPAITGSPRGSRGTYGVENCYFRDNNVAHFRNSSDGSYIERSVIHNTGNVPHKGGVVASRGIYSVEGSANWTVEVRECDIEITSDNTNGTPWVGSAHYTNNSGSTPAEIHFVDCEIRGNHRNASAANIRETNVGTDPDTSIPDGVPTSAEAAAAGTAGSDDGEDDPIELPEDAHLLAFVTDPEAQFADHEFRAAGPVEFTEAPYESPSGHPIVGGSYVAEDFVEELEDGTWRAGGVTGGGYGDAYLVDGPITEIQIGKPDVMWAELDGESMSPEAIIEETAEEPGDGDDGNGDDGDNGDDGEEPTPGSLAVEVVETNEPLQGGDAFELTAAVENPGDESADGTVRLLVGSGADEVDAVDVALDAGGSETVTLGYETFPVKQDVSFPVRVESDDDADEVTVEVGGRD